MKKKIKFAEAEQISRSRTKVKNMSADKFWKLLALFFIFIFLFYYNTSAQLVDTLSVYAISTTPVYSIPLLANVDYEITCMEEFSLWQGGNGKPAGEVDAAYFIDIPAGEFGNGLEPLPTNISNGFLINDETVITLLGKLPGVSPTHTYIVSMKGTGGLVKFFIEDRPPFGSDRHSDNSGFIKVEIRRISPNVSVNTTRIDFGDVLVGTNKDSSVIFHNSSRSGLTVNLSNIIGTNAGDFSILGSASFTIYQNQDSSVWMRFTPGAVGKRYGAVLFNTNDPASPQVRIDLEGNGIAPSISVNPLLIDFGEVELGSYKDTTFEIQNTGTALLIVQSISLSGNTSEYQINSPASFTLQSGQRQIISVRFSPTSIRRKDASADIQSNAGGISTTSIALTGVGVTTLTAGFTNNHHGAPEEVVTIPVELFENRDGSDATSFEFLVRYNYRILYPRRVINANTLSKTFSLQSIPLRAGVMKIVGTNGQPLKGTGTLVNLEFLLLFGDTTYSALIIDSLKFNDGNPRAKMINGIFTLDSACNQFLRRITEVGRVQLRQNTPNPFNPTTTISYYIPIEQHVKLDVLDMLGRNVVTLVDEFKNAGEYKCVFYAQNLPSGIYVYQLRTMEGVATRRMIITR